MRMTSLKLVALRLVMITLGRWGWFAERFKKFMVNKVVVKKSKDRYVASSRYFTWDQLD
jgi:hypothetical protein